MGSLKFFKNKKKIIFKAYNLSDYLLMLRGVWRACFDTKLHKIKSNQFQFHFQFESNQFNSNVIRNKIFWHFLVFFFFFAFFSINSKRVYLKQTTTKEFYLFSAFSIGNKSIICLQSNLFFLIFFILFFYEIFK